MNSEADNVIDNDYCNDGNGGHNDRDDESLDQHSQVQSINNDAIQCLLRSAIRDQ